MVFDDGFFHADPHPGNFFVESDGRIGLIDFGMVGMLDERNQEELADVLLAITSHDADRLVDALLELGVAQRRIERSLLRQDVDHLVSRYYGRPLGEMALGPMLNDTFAVVRRHRLRLPPTLVLLFKTLLMSEGLAVQLDPSFNLTQVLVPYAERLLRRQYSPLRWAHRLGQASLDAARLGVDLPQQLRRIIADLERGGLEVGMRPTGVEPLIQRFEKLANRIVLGIIVAAFVIGLAVLMSVYHPAGSQEWIGAIFAVGFGFASALGAYLAWTILRSGRG